MKSFVLILTISFGTLAIGLLGMAEQGGRGRGGGNQAQSARHLVWVDRAGNMGGGIGPEMSSILDPSISPDATKIAVRGREEPGQTDSLWIFEGNSKRRLTENTGAERHMIWSPDGQRIVYSIQNQGGVSNLYIRNADGSGDDQPLVVSEGRHKWYPSWSPDGETVVFHTNDPQTQARDLWFVNVTNGTTGVLVDDPGIQALARMSLDGRFVAYQSNQSGKMEIYVTTFPRSNKRWKVSTNGGTWAKWSVNELFYWEGNTLMAVEFSDENGFTAENPKKLFTGAEVGMAPDNMMTSYNPEYDVISDGTRFIISQNVN